MILSQTSKIVNSVVVGILPFLLGLLLSQKIRKTKDLIPGLTYSIKLKSKVKILGGFDAGFSFGVAKRRRLDF
jgi:hypothetical protein